MEAYESGIFDEAYAVYNEFKSVIQQRVVVEKTIPIEPLKEFGVVEAPSTGGYLYEPNQEELLRSLLPKYVQAQVYRILLESLAAEQAALFIIDEPELSLNSSWQRKLIHALLAITEHSRVQFLMASHSHPLIGEHLAHAMPLDDLKRQ